MGIHVINCCGQTMAGGWLLGDSTTQHHNPWAGSYHCLTSIHDPKCFWHCSIDLNCNLSWHLFGAWKGDCKRVRKREREINININIYIGTIDCFYCYKYVDTQVPNAPTTLQRFGLGRGLQQQLLERPSTVLLRLLVVDIQILLQVGPRKYK